MSESGSGLSDLLDDYAERNAALFLFLGLLAPAEKLKRTLDAEAVDAVSVQAAGETRLDYLVLGLVAFAGQVLKTADQVKEDIVAHGQIPADHPSDLLR